jgi:hypothetical protein
VVQRAFATLALVACFAVAITTTASGAVTFDRLVRIASALSETRFYVDPDASHLFDPEHREQIRAALDELEWETFVVAVPLLADDESQGMFDLFLQNLHNTVGVEGLYVVIDVLTGEFGMANYGAPVVVERARTVREPTSRVPLSQHVLTFVDELPTLHSSDPRWVDNRVEEPPRTSRSEFDDEPLYVQAGVMIAFGGIAGLLFCRFVLVPFEEFLRPRRKLIGKANAPTTPSARRLERMASIELRRLSRQLSYAAPEPEQLSIHSEPYEYASRCYDAALLIMSERGEPIDHVGVIALARSGRLALDDRHGSRRPCYANPLHPPGTHWRILRPSSGYTSRVHVCEACTRGWRRFGPQHALRVPRLDYEVPYYEIRGWWEDIWPDLGPDVVLERLGVS